MPACPHVAPPAHGRPSRRGKGKRNEDDADDPRPKSNRRKFITRRSRPSIGGE
ncbi:MAG: hypothetical protein H7Y09_05160 [Chitinophagaceae bacterium]|nr:hypothetical protein [Anaerolineae bacterium]